MADKKIVAEMATQFSVDSTKAVESIKDLKSQVNGLGKEWKIQETQLKSAGDQMGATQARVDGLTRQYETNGRAIDKIKQDMSGLNREVASEREEYNKLSQQLLRAETQQNSLNSQLNRATTTLAGYKDGTIQLNKELKEQGSLTQATVERLQAEGKAEEANTVKLKGLSEQKERYNQLLTTEKGKLADIANTLGTGSSEYTKQATYVERLGAKLAHTNNEFKDLSKVNVKPNLNGLNIANEKLSSLNERIKHTQTSVSHIFLGNVLANGFSAALGSIRNQFSSLIEGGTEYTKQQQVMNATWTTLTDSASKGKAMVDSVNQISTAFGQTSEVTNELEQQFYHVFNQKAPTDQLTKSMLTMADTLGMNSEQVERLGLNFTHMLGSGRLQLGDFNMITDQLPMYGEKLLEFEQKAQHNTKLTMGELRKQMSAGKISAQDATAVINELGDKYRSASENMMGTASGMERVISARGKALSSALISPIINAKNPLFGVISKWVSDKSTEKAFSGVGDSISKGFSTITSAFGKNFKGADFTKSMNNGLNGLSKNITKFSDYIASHSKQITAFFKSVKEIGGDAFNTVKSTIQTLLPVLKLVGGEMAKHPKLVGSLVVAWLSFAPALKATSKLISGVTGTFKVFQKVAGGFGFVFKKNEAGISRFGKVLGGLKKTVGGIGKVFSTTFKGIGKVVSVFGKSIGGLGKLIGKTLSVAGKAFLTFGKAIGLAFKANPIGFIVTTVIALGAALVGLYKHNAKFRSFVNGLAKSVMQFIKPILGWVNGVIKGVVKAVQGLWKSLSRFFNQGFTNIQNLMNVFKDLFSGNWGKLGKDVGKLASGMWTQVKGIFSGAFKWLDGLTNGWFSGMIKGFTNFGKGISDTFSGIWSGIKKFATNGMNDVIGVINGAIKGIDGIISDFGGPKSALKTIPKFANGTQGAPKGLAVVNDGKGADSREAIIDNSNNVHILSGKNRLVNFAGGETVIPAEMTRAMFPHFEKGTEGWLGKATDWVKDKFDDVTSFLAHPLEAIMKVINHIIKSSLGGASSFVGSFAPAIGNMLGKAIVDPIKKLLGGLGGDGSVDAGGTQGNPGGSGVERWRGTVLKALSVLGLSSSLVDKVLRQINTESGGNPTIHQGVMDINMRLGQPAQGLMQVIPPTFNAYKVAGHNNILNGYDNILAGLNYAKHRYGSSLSFLGQGHGYANGGLITQHQIAEIGEGNQPEMIIPLSKMKNTRAIQLLQQAVSTIAKNNGVEQHNHYESDNSDVVKAVNGLSSILMAILGVNKQQLAQGNTPQSMNLNDLMNQMGNAQSMYNYQRL